MEMKKRNRAEVSVRDNGDESGGGKARNVLYVQRFGAIMGIR